VVVQFGVSFSFRVCRVAVIPAKAGIHTVRMPTVNPTGARNRGCERAGGVYTAAAEDAKREILVYSCWPWPVLSTASAERSD